MPPFKAPGALTHAELAAVVAAVQSVLWRGDDGEIDPEKQWYPDTLDEIAHVLLAAGLGVDDAGA